MKKADKLEAMAQQLTPVEVTNNELLESIDKVPKKSEIKKITLDVDNWNTNKANEKGFSLTPKSQDKIIIKEHHRLTNAVKSLLETKEVDSKLINNEYQDLYGYLIEKSNIHQAKVLDEVAKATKIPKTALNKDFEAFVKNQNMIKAEKIKEKQLINYKKIFKKIGAVEIPQSYAVNEQYLEYYQKEDMPITICKVFTIGTKILAKDRAYYEIEKVENNYKKTIVATARDLTDAKKVATMFADTGEIFDSTKANLVTKFISEYTRINEDKIQTKIGRTETGWDNGNFYLPQLSNDCVWIDNPSQLDKSFVSKGDMNSQIRMLRELSKGKVFLLSLASLSSSLYGVLDGINLNFTLHLGGLRGEGKSLAVKSAIALYGVPDVSQYGRNWNATLSGIETYVERFKCVPAWCDELEAAKSPADVVTFMYAFSEGAGRARAMVKDGDVVDREIKTFKGILFSTGEKNIDEVIKNMGKERNIPLGTTRRVLDLKVDDIWNGVDKEVVGDLLDDNHGLFISRWIKIISEDKELIQSSFKELRKNFNWKLEGKEQFFYLMVTVLRFLTKHNVIDKSTFELQLGFIKELVEKEGVEMLKNKNIAEAFLNCASDFVVQNANYFIMPSEGFGTIDMPNIIHGKIDDNNISFRSGVFKQICIENGLVQAQVIDALIKDNLIALDSKGKPTKVVKMYKGNTTRCYVINKKAVQPAEEENNKYEIIFE